MLRIFTNKWILGSFIVLLLVGAGCVLWYHYTLAPYKQEAAATQQLVQEWTASQHRVKSSQEVDGVERQDVASAGHGSVSAAPATKKTDTLLDTADTTETVADSVSTAEPETEEVVRESPFGFGAYPKIPATYRDLDGISDIWAYYEELAQTDPEAARMNELGERILVKLWNPGLSPTGGTHSNGRFYPNYPNTVYVTWEEDVLEDGTIQRYPTQISGDPSFAAYEAAFIESDGEIFPSNFTMLNHKKDGIDPYQFLYLP